MTVDDERCQMKPDKEDVEDTLLPDNRSIKDRLMERSREIRVMLTVCYSKLKLLKQERCSACLGNETHLTKMNDIFSNRNKFFFTYCPTPKVTKLLYRIQF